MAGMESSASPPWVTGGEISEPIETQAVPYSPELERRFRLRAAAELMVGPNLASIDPLPYLEESK